MFNFLKVKYYKFLYRNVKPTRNRINGMKYQHAVYESYGGKSNENHLVVVDGYNYKCYPLYHRKGEVRQNTYSLNVDNVRI